jgi:hypothetical protein
MAKTASYAERGLPRLPAIAEPQAAGDLRAMSGMAPSYIGLLTTSNVLLAAPSRFCAVDHSATANE